MVQPGPLHDMPFKSSPKVEQKKIAQKKVAQQNESPEVAAAKTPVAFSIPARESETERRLIEVEREIDQILKVLELSEFEEGR
jgi:hypothetical protein